MTQLSPLTADLDLIANRLAELGHPTRLQIFQLLVQAGPSGMAVGRVQQQLEIPSSTLSHHLGKLVKVGLVTQERDKNTLCCQPQFAALQAVCDFLLHECCAGGRSSCREVGSEVECSTETSAGKCER